MDKIVEQILNNHGHNLQFGVGDILRALGWRVELSRHIRDIDTDLSREADIIAHKEIDIFNDCENKVTQRLNVVLPVECRWLKEPVVFYNINNNTGKAKESIHHKVPKMDEILSENPHNFHYLNVDNISITHAVNDQKDLFDCLQKTIKTVLYLKGVDSGLKIYYPMIVVDGPGKLYLSDDCQNKKVVESSHIIYSLNHPYLDISSQRDPNFYIDIISKPILKEFLEKLLKEEVGEVKKCLSWRETMQSNHGTSVQQSRKSLIFR